VVLIERRLEADIRYVRVFALWLAFGSLILPVAAQKPSPFVPRKSEPPVAGAAPAAPVSPVFRGSKPVSTLNNRAILTVPPVVYGEPAPPDVVAAPLPSSVPPVIPRVSHAEPEPPAKAVAAVPEPVHEVVAVVPAKEPHLEDVEAGVSREEVVAKAGPPSVAISMFDEDSGGSVESMRYEWKGAWVGTVRLSKGKVTRVDRPR